MLKWIKYVVTLFLLSQLFGCKAGTLGNMTMEDIQKIDHLSAIVQAYGPQGRASVRSGRPIIAAMINGFIIIPGTELDLEVSAEPTRSAASSSVSGIGRPSASPVPAIIPTRKPDGRRVSRTVSRAQVAYSESQPLVNEAPE